MGTPINPHAIKNSLNNNLFIHFLKMNNKIGIIINRPILRMVIMVMDVVKLYSGYVSLME